jgi:hypothetical protein
VTYIRDKSPGANQMVMTIQLRADDKWWVQLYEQFVDVEIPSKPNLMKGKLLLHSSGPYSNYDKAAEVARTEIISQGTLEGG